MSDFLSPDEAEGIAGIVKNVCQMAMFITADQARAAANQIEAHIRLFWDDVLRQIHETSTVPLVPASRRPTRPA